MNVVEFRKNIRLDSVLEIEGKEYRILEIVKFRFSSGEIYFKLWLENDFVLADDLDENCFILVKELNTDFELPFPRELEFKGKKFKFSYDAEAVAEEVIGEEIYPKEESEKFWDYEADDGSYLSLGINNQTGQRMDLYGKIVEPKDIKI